MNVQAQRASKTVLDTARSPRHSPSQKTFPAPHWTSPPPSPTLHRGKFDESVSLGIVLAKLPPAACFPSYLPWAGFWPLFSTDQKSKPTGQRPISKRRILW